MFDLTGKSALVTGASGGIGRAIALALAGAGARVALSGTRRDALESVAKEIAAAHSGSTAVVVTANLSDAASVEQLAKDAEAALGGGIDILVNNAGITRDNLSIRMKDDEWQSVLDVNLTAGFRLARAVTKGMMKRRWGRVIGIGSVVGTTGNAGQVNYAAAKAGLVGMTKALAAELATRGITANVVSPGFIQTAMTDALTEAQQAAILPKVPAGRLGRPEEIAGAVLYLASDEAGYVTGQTLHVNGGMAMI
jgi:3-oxoacyl-[acyl-carrier protein] reductase